MKNSKWTAGALVVLFLGMTAFAFYTYWSQDWFGPVASHHGEGVDQVIRYLLWTTGIILIVGHLALAGLVWRNTDRREAYQPVDRKTERRFAVAAGLTMAIVAEVGVLVIGLPVWSEVYGAAPEDALVVEITGRQFEWVVRYPGPDGVFGATSSEKIDPSSNPLGLDGEDPAAADDVLFLGDMYLPVNRPISLRIRALDVLHSFSVQEFRIKQDAVPGATTTTQFVPTQEGDFEIACAELCGLGHYRMRGKVVVLSEEDYERQDWQNQGPRVFWEDF